jgi:hypothetical protein
MEISYKHLGQFLYIKAEGARKLNPGRKTAYILNIAES